MIRIVLLCGAVTLGSASCGVGSQAETDVEPPPVEAVRVAPPDSAIDADAGEVDADTGADEAAHAGTAAAADTLPRLTPEGWGPLRIGMTREEVVAAAGEDANPEAVGGPDPERCDEFRPERMPEGTIVMVVDGRLARISLGAGSGVRTDRGFRVGDPAAEVEAAYGGSAEVEPHYYVDAPARYLTVWTVAPPAPEPRGIVYEVGGDGLVARIHAGGPAIRRVEGCV